MLPQLSPEADAVQVMFFILIRLRETAKRNNDIIWVNKNELVEKIFQDIIPNAKTQAEIVTRNLISYHLNAF